MYYNNLRKTVSKILTLATQSNVLNNVAEALDVLLDYFSAERIFIGSFSDDSDGISFFSSRNTQDSIPVSQHLSDMLKEDCFSSLLTSLRAGNDVIIHDTSLKSSGSAYESELFLSNQILSTLLVPTYYGGNINGFIGLDHLTKKRAWTPQEVNDLRMFAHIISIVIQQIRMERDSAVNKREAMQSNLKFKLIFNELNSGVILLDEKSLIADINKSGIEIFGTTREALIGLDMMSCPALPEELIRSMTIAHAHEDYNKTFPYDFEIIKQTNFYPTTISGIKYLKITGMALFDEDDQIAGFLAIIMDDTEDYLKNELIQSNLAKLKVAIDTGESLIWEYDTATRTFEVEFTTKSHESHEDIAYIKNNPISSLEEYMESIHPDDATDMATHFEQLLKGKTGSFICTYRRYINERLFWFHINVRTYKYNADATPLKIVCYSTNVTKIREQEFELIKVKESDKMKSAFIANMSHEIRTPLNAIVGFSNLIAEENRTNDNEHLIEQINKNNDILLGLVDDILDFSKIEAGMMNYFKALFDVREVCEEVIEEYKKRAPADIRLTFRDSSLSTVVYTDRKRIKQIMSNLINNAFKFTKAGSIGISCETVADNFLRVNITDTGIGIAEKELPHLFNRFYKGNSFKVGVGLGLTVAKTIANDLGGAIGVASEFGKGSTFWFTIPLPEPIEEID